MNEKDLPMKMTSKDDPKYKDDFKKMASQKDGFRNKKNLKLKITFKLKKTS